MKTIIGLGLICLGLCGTTKAAEKSVVACASGACQPVAETSKHTVKAAVKVRPAKKTIKSLRQLRAECSCECN